MSDFEPVHSSQDWMAWEQRGPDGLSFRVSGTVVVKATNYSARLEEHRSGFNPKIRMLKLFVVSTGEVGGDALTPLTVQYAEQPYREGSYTAVTVLHDGGKGVSIRQLSVKQPVYELVSLNPAWTDRTHLKIACTGRLRTTGWTAEALTPRIYKRPPPDGIWEFDFVAIVPVGATLPSLPEVTATYDWIVPFGSEARPRGIRVYSETNSLEWLF